MLWLSAGRERGLEEEGGKANRRGPHHRASETTGKILDFNLTATGSHRDIVCAPQFGVSLLNVPDAALGEVREGLSEEESSWGLMSPLFL